MNLNTNVLFTEIYVWGNDEYGQLGLGHRYLSRSESSRSDQHSAIGKEEDSKKLNIPKSCTFQT